VSDVIRTEYDGHGLDESAMPAAPWPTLQAWVEEAREARETRPDVPEPDALSVATADAEGHPHVRTVLLRYLAPDGIGFYTNLDSRKGRDLAENPAVAASLTWPSLFRSIRFAGHVELLSREIVTGYFQSRPWGSRVGAWASRQSHRVPSRADLEHAYTACAERWPDHGQPDDVPIPASWGGYRVVCDEVEFWGGRRSRLHDRLVYTRTGVGDLDDGTAWQLDRLYP
jgi:pyridoxamine 5'-phosphate oxidase